MLFSNESIAQLIDDQYEPVWESVRPVPQVTIDFGNGTVVKRTLHGNVATYVCTAQGRVIDVLPGVYDRATYEQELKRMAALHQQNVITCRSDPISLYHRDEFAKANESSLVSLQTTGIDDVLSIDTQYNLQVRRQAIHEYLKEFREIRPDEMKGWLYREVLHADLDDPYLGLGNALFANYPIVNEDQ